MSENNQATPPPADAKAELAAKAKAAADAQTKADAAELAELRAFKAAREGQAAAATPVAPEGATLYVNTEGEERYFTPETYALLAPDYAGFGVKPAKPDSLPKA